jgi:hypothetical protein
MFNRPRVQRLWVFGNVLRKELHSNKAPEVRVLGLVDYTHPTATELFDDAVVRDGPADHAQECYGESVGTSMKAVELAIS